MKKIILYDAKCLSDSTKHGDWVIDTNSMKVHRQNSRIIFGIPGYEFYLEYKDQLMAQEAMDYLSDALCETDGAPGFKMPIYDKDHDILNAFTP